MTFGEALEALKEGKQVARAGWNGKKMYLWLNKGSFDYHSTVKDGKATIDENIEGIPAPLFEGGDSGTITRLPNINMRAATGSTVTGWLASQTDVLAEDWVIVY